MNYISTNNVNFTSTSTSNPYIQRPIEQKRGILRERNYLSENQTSSEKSKKVQWSKERKLRIISKEGQVCDYPGLSYHKMKIVLEKIRELEKNESHSFVQNIVVVPAVAQIVSLICDIEELSSEEEIVRKFAWVICRIESVNDLLCVYENLEQFKSENENFINDPYFNAQLNKCLNIVQKELIQRGVSLAFFKVSR